MGACAVLPELSERGITDVSKRRPARVHARQLVILPSYLLTQAILFTGWTNPDVTVAESAPLWRRDSNEYPLGFQQDCSGASAG